MPTIDERQELAKKADLATKQNTLTPGTGITIVNDVISSTSGSTVTVSPTLSSGTPIAAITVDGNINTLFAPTPPTISVTQTQLSGDELATITVNGTPFTIYAPEGTVVLSGTSAPTSAQGDDNDLYVQYTVTSGVYTVDMTYVKLSGEWIELAASGSEVEANPQGAATDTLNKIDIDGTIYSVGGGNSQPGLGYKETVLWENTSGTTSSSTITLSSALDNYDAIYIITASNAEPNYKSTQIIPVSAIDTTGTTNFGIFDTGGDNYYYVVLNYVDSTHITLSSWGSSYPIKYYKVVGINYGAGGTPIQPIIYSEEEREVGVWTDGKPLYQKSFSGITSTSGNATSIMSASNIDSIIGVNGYINDGTNQYCIPYRDGGDYISVYRTSSDVFTNYSNYFRGKSFILTLQYTKTTDTHGSGIWTPQGVPAVHYSTDEQVIGTWIDEDTLYEKTITFTAPSNNYVIVATNIANFSKCIGYSGIVMLGSGIFEDINYSRPDSNNSTYYTAITATGDVFFRTYEATTGTVYITMRYTKSTS